MKKMGSVVMLGGMPLSGKSTVVRTLVDEFGFNSDHVVSGDRLRKEMWAKLEPSYVYPDEVPKEVMKQACFNLLLAVEFISRAKLIASSGNIALVHSGFTTEEFRTAFQREIKPYKTLGFWLSVDRDCVAQRLEDRRNNNRTHGTCDENNLAPIFARKAETPKGWINISTTHITPSEAASKIHNTLNPI